MPIEITLVIVVCIVSALILLLAVVRSNREAEGRREALQQVATTVGFDFREDSGRKIRANFIDLHLYKQGHKQALENCMTGSMDDGLEVAAFDYRYTTGPRSRARTTHQTVVCIHGNDLQLPAVEVRPETLIHKIGGVVGYQDIDFPEHPGFSRKFLLRSPDFRAAIRPGVPLLPEEANIRARFTPSVIAFFEERPQLCVEANKDGLLFYEAGRRLKPEEWAPFIQDARALVKMWRR